MGIVFWTNEINWCINELTSELKSLKESKCIFITSCKIFKCLLYLILFVFCFSLQKPHLTKKIFCTLYQHVEPILHACYIGRLKRSFNITSWGCIEYPSDVYLSYPWLNRRCCELQKIRYNYNDCLIEIPIKYFFLYFYPLAKLKIGKTSAVSDMLSFSWLKSINASILKGEITGAVLILCCWTSWGIFFVGSWTSLTMGFLLNDWFESNWYWACSWLILLIIGGWLLEYCVLLLRFLFVFSLSSSCVNKLRGTLKNWKNLINQTVYRYGDPHKLIILTHARISALCQPNLFWRFDGCICCALSKSYRITNLRWGLNFWTQSFVPLEQICPST